MHNNKLIIDEANTFLNDHESTQNKIYFDNNTENIDNYLLKSYKNKP